MEVSFCFARAIAVNKSFISESSHAVPDKAR